MKIAIHQPNYLPWLGYFNKISRSDVFVFLDNVQYSKNSYINRTNILGNNGKIWLTQPVSIKGKFGSLIKDVEVADFVWKEKHLKTICQFYCKHPFFKELSSVIELFSDINTGYIAEINMMFIKRICKILGFDKEFKIASQLNLPNYEEPTERLVAVIRHLGGKEYISGAGGVKYHREELFAQNGIKLTYLKWNNVVYKQYRREEFIEGLSIVDAIANIGVQQVLRLMS